MFKKTAPLLAACIALSACASGTPHVIQPSADAPELHLKSGMATQIEMPHAGRVQSVTVGNPSLLTAEREDGVVNLVPKAASGETNLIVRSTDEDGDAKVYQYRIIVSDH